MIIIPKEYEKEVPIKLARSFRGFIPDSLEEEMIRHFEEQEAVDMVLSAQNHFLYEKEEQ